MVKSPATSEPKRSLYKENTMIEYKTGTDIIDWKSITDLYGKIGLVAEFGKKRDQKKIREAFLNSFKVVTAWEDYYQMVYVME